MERRTARRLAITPNNTPDYLRLLMPQLRSDTIAEHRKLAEVTSVQKVRTNRAIHQHLDYTSNLSNTSLEQP